MMNGMNTDRFIMLTPIGFLSSVRAFMFEGHGNERRLSTLL
jgi:hypothetical protein